MMDAAPSELTQDVKGKNKQAGVERLHQWRILLAFSTLSCASSVELSGPLLTASTEPTVIGNISERVSALVVDDQRLYWMGTDGDAPVGRKVSLQSCLKEHCVGSLVTYAASGVNESARFGVENGEIYWTDQASQWNACDVTGCTGEPRHFGFGTPAPDATAFTSEELFVCARGDGLWRVPLSGDAAATKLDVPDTFGCSSVTAYGGYVYWTVGRGLSNIQRWRTDGSGSVEVFAKDLELRSAWDDDTRNFPSNLVVGDRYVYWSQGGLRGSIARCPVTGCVGAPEPFAGLIRSPGTLLLTTAELYWQHSTNTRGIAVSRCALAECMVSEPIAQGVDAANVLAADDNYLYTATTSQPLSPDVVWSNPVAQIRRIPR